MKINHKTKKLWRNRLIFLGVIAIAVVAYIWYINSNTIYDFSHLTRTMDFGDGAPFTPLTPIENSRVEGMSLAAETSEIALYINEYDTTFAIYDKRNGTVWHSSPQGPEHVANPWQRGVMRSNMGFSFYDINRRPNHRWIYNDSATFGPNQFTITSLDNGIRIEYIVGNMDIGLHAIPRYITEELFDEMHDYFLSIDPADGRFFRLQWREFEEDNEYAIYGFRWLIEGIFDHAINTTRMLDMFDDFGWSFEETAYFNALAGYDPEISFDFFTAVFEIVLDRDRMIVNVPINGIEAQGDIEADLFAVSILPFFGAGSLEDDGFILVPSGSGGVINFNNGQYREMAFELPVYGVDFLTTVLFPQMEQPTRLPVFGIQNNNAAFLAHIYSGQALGTVHADVAAETIGVGGTSAHNNAWFSFLLRQSMNVGMGGIPGGGGDMTVVQNIIYTGDITVMYHFIAEENPGVGGMAQAYQGFLVDEGILTPLNGPGDRSFYLDILGAIDVQRHFLGTPYMSLEVMTSLEDAHGFLDTLNASGVNRVQMQLHGWFNRGINHDVAKQVNPIRGVGNARELQEMNTRLQLNGGGLHPVVNFQLTNYFSRNFSRNFESARDPGGYFGFMSRVARDMMFTRFSIHRNDWFVIIHPAVIPFHVDEFIPNFERRVGIDGLALADMGDILSESIHRRDAVDREHSRLISVSQMERLNENFHNLVVFGGNDYSLAFASHIVDAPTETDRFHKIDYDVPFYSMVLHGFIEFAGRPANMRENFSPLTVLLNSMTTGASPRYILSALPTRHAQFSPHERFYSTHYVNWMDTAILHYEIFNNVYRHLRAERIVGFDVLAGGQYDIMGSEQVTVTVFSNGTRIYVNNTGNEFVAGEVTIPPQWFVVTGGVS